MKKNSIEPKSRKRNQRELNKGDRKITIGMDLGDKTSRYCVLDQEGQVLQERSVGTTRKAMMQVFGVLGACLRICDAVTQKSARGVARICIREGRRVGQLAG